ncbi:MAG: GTPase HflX [Paludibacter sp.]|nr:GTPase HflX [Bacteroidales bacterium]MCM1069746.1 GTPase HflX [Prevotella sp.]MCM1354431.1 GTPase HflX [Bacteroides sp.]MCM1443231.1 GTPase HflX [Muribaculum sp.]MCM1482465.1 GTPase HflX [Paludibacter sp.]
MQTEQPIDNRMRAILVGLITPAQPEERTNEYLDELAFLADTDNILPVRRFIQRLDQPNSNCYVGEGKLAEIKNYIEQCKENQEPLDLVIFDDELSPRQLRNIEKTLGIRIMDRTILILEIFLLRAQTSYAKTQVEMAHLQYMLPRLTRMWSHLDRQRGGGTTSRGMGETQIEADKRIIKNRIALLREDLKKIDRQMATQRQNRGKMVRVALVGYTNVGKSTLMNLLSKSDVFAENKLFATLDTTVRKVTIDNLPFLLSDTVGFIRKLPHNLIESFKSTLDEVREADLLIHVVDISHPNFEEQYNVVEQTINDILHPDDKNDNNRKQIPEIVVFNKTDTFHYTPKEEDDLTPIGKENIPLEELEKTWMSRMDNDCIFISARQKDNIEPLKQIMYQRIKAIHVERYPYNDFLFQKYE